MKAKRKPGEFPPRDWTAADVETMRAMVAAGASSREIATALRRSIGAVAARRRVLGLLQDEAARFANIRKAIDAVPRDVLRAAGHKAGSTGWTPERRAMAARLMRERMQHPDMRNLGNAVIAANPDILARRAAAMVETKVSGCPVEYRAERRQLVKVYGSAIANQMIGDQIAADKRRASIAEAAANGWSMAFQEQLERVRAGTSMVVPQRKLHRADPTFSLTGCATGML